RGYPYWRIARDFIGAPGYERRWDPVARAPYLWSQSTGRFITYDDPQSLAEKARLVRKYNLGGIMYWEHSEDPTEVLLDAITSGLR
ncbi:MAG TPA: glycosyl hydrolase family 18 protein, partial [Thermoanaerobaculia bacterium]|nr:glycosyl hydrolase family 18 protein [Thermoanaerobaculia bacterium]